MPTPARLANLVLIIALLGLGGYAYWEHRLRVSQAGDLEALIRERADLRQQLWKRAAARPAPASAAAEAAEGPTRGSDGDLPPDIRNQRVGDMFNRFTNLMDSPEAQRLLGIQQRAALDAKYSALFKAMHLAPEQLEKFKSLLVEKQNAVLDVMAAARAQGLNPRDNRTEIAQLIQGTQAEVDSSIRNALGDAAYSQYQTFEQTVPQRNTVGQLEARLSYTDQPLTPQQSDSLVSILASNATGANRTNAGAAGGMLGRLGGTAGGSATITDAAVNQAQTVLSGPQVQALQQLQQEQQAQAKLRQLMRTLRSTGGAAGTGTGTVSPPVPPKG
jgi:hypothetical protein